jgi:hypothetical protein
MKKLNVLNNYTSARKPTIPFHQQLYILIMNLRPKEKHMNLLVRIQTTIHLTTAITIELKCLMVIENKNL